MHVEKWFQVLLSNTNNSIYQVFLSNTSNSIYQVLLSNNRFYLSSIAI